MKQAKPSTANREYHQARRDALVQSHQAFLFMQLFGEYAVHVSDITHYIMIQNTMGGVEKGKQLEAWKNKMRQLLLVFSNDQRARGGMDPDRREQEQLNYIRSVENLVNTMIELDTTDLKNVNNMLNEFFFNLVQYNTGSGSGYWNGSMTKELKRAMYDFVSSMGYMKRLREQQSNVGNVFYNTGLSFIRRARYLGELLDDMLE